MIKRLFEWNNQLLLAGLLFVVSCHQAPPGDSKAIKEELRQREIVHLTPSQITERAYEFGDSLSNLCEKELNNELKTRKTISCIPTFERISAPIAKKFDASFRRLGLWKSPDLSKASKNEKTLLEAYVYSYQNKQALPVNLQKLGDKEFLYTRPLTISDNRCISCHSGYAVGDTLGLWVLKFPKRQVVMSFVE